MIRMTAASIADTLGGELAGGDGDRTIDRVAIDSREVGDGCAFFAIVGPRDDGHRYLPQAIAGGAELLVIQRREALPHLENPTGVALVVVAETTAALQKLATHVRNEIDPTVVAITGSVGKTTTKALTLGLLSGSASTLATPGNFNNHWGLPLSLLGLQSEHEWMVAEMGMSHAGEIALLAELARPDVGVITNVAPVHMENFESVAGVAAAKRELAEGLSGDGVLILNVDNRWTAAMADDFENRVGGVIRFGSGAGAAVRATDVQQHDGGWNLCLQTPGGRAAGLSLPLAGEHSVSNFLAAAAVAHALGVGPETIAERTAQLRLPAMRGEAQRSPDGVLVIDDSYNASPAAMLSAIETLAAAETRRHRIMAAGDMLELGTWAEDAHREVGLHAAASGIDCLITVGPLARDIARGAAAGGMAQDVIHSFTDSHEAADAIRDMVAPGDTVLVKGSRGIRMERLTHALLTNAEPS
ncbi:MAG: UDP-N-acetylmuramoyl-tripeptide--D-alanyl-D-alanine ligase [Acidobacteria bacterium]|nr:UDP-N-acetylmuramoyl-tripeptide--D-alanyl-D-alanine ligase [Acidobacteriota bacterium]